MKLRHVTTLLGVMVLAASAQEKGPDSTQPQPRVRLDPSRQKAITRPVAEEKKESDVPLMLERMDVKEAAPVPMHRPAVEDPSGELSFKNGGRVWRRDAGAFRMEAGIWPHIDLFDDEARFKPMKVPLEFDFLRIRF